MSIEAGSLGLPCRAGASTASSSSASSSPPRIRGAMCDTVHGTLDAQAILTSKVVSAPSRGCSMIAGQKEAQSCSEGPGAQVMRPVQPGSHAGRKCPQPGPLPCIQMAAARQQGRLWGSARPQAEGSTGSARSLGERAARALPAPGSALLRPSRPRPICVPVAGPAPSGATGSPSRQARCPHSRLNTHSPASQPGGSQSRGVLGKALRRAAAPP